MNSFNYRMLVANNMNNVCRGCDTCDGNGCIGEVPGMGGKGFSGTFINNCLSWNEIDVPLGEIPEIGVAPMTGVGQNMGNVFPENLFHDYLVAGAKKAGVYTTIGDGTPDFKLQNGIEAMQKHGVTGAVFIKPYPNHVILDRFDMADCVAEIIGVDIDSHHIPTMEGLVSLEEKTALQLLELKEYSKKPFIIKGVQSERDLEIVKIVKPDFVVVSNHGGRVFDNGEGIAYRLQALMPELSKYTGEVWVDGGLRSLEHLKKASSLGAKKVLIGRPFIQVTATSKEDGVSNWLKELI